MSERTAWQERQRFDEERAADLRERDHQREPRGRWRRSARELRARDELRTRLTETIADAQPDGEERLDETTEVTP